MIRLLAFLVSDDLPEAYFYHTVS